ncbi:hypothetical protein ACFWD7_06275 [Streptomyces mirabilis]|uniref:hypothetical protein n=1 Tax=Streptomyces mirabilis TaxID=68239 RepID=UPI003679767A
MEILLIAACAWLVHTAGAQSEQSKMGLSPAQRDILREQTRHEKAVQKIADRHGVTQPSGNQSGVSPWKEPPSAKPGPALTIPEAFRSGYRNRTTVERVATPIGRHAGRWTAQGVAWIQDTGKGAVREYRKRRRAEGHDDPAPVLVPLPPAHPPKVPAMPTEPPVAGTDKGVTVKKAEVKDKVAPSDAPEAATAPEAAADGAGSVPKALGPEEFNEWVKGPLELPADRNTSGSTPPAAAAPAAEPAPTAPDSQSAVTEPTKDKEPAVAGEGVGRMAAEVTYESVMDESDELSLMCDDDVRVYGRIRTRSEREIGRGDELIAALENAGFGAKVIGWVARCKEQYQVIYGQLDELETNTIAQGEQVTKAKALLEAGQGVYADIAQDMESVAERGSYVSDAVDAEDTSAHTEVYETKAA